MKSKILCKNCENSFIIDEDELVEAKKDGIQCPECSQSFDDTIVEQLENAFKSIHEHQKLTEVSIID